MNDSTNTSADDGTATQGHSRWVGQPHAEGEPAVISAAEAHAAEISTSRHPLGKPGKRFDRWSPFMIGMAGAAGVIVTVGFARLLLDARDALVLVVAALFLAIGIEPVVSWMTRHRVRRGVAVAIVFVCVLAGLAGFLAAAITPLIDQGRALIDHAPDQLRHLEDTYPIVRTTSARLHLDEKLREGIANDTSWTGGLLGAGKVVFGAITSTVIVAVLTAYFSANFPTLRAYVYRFFPHARRPRAILIGDAIFAKVGGYVLGNLLISLITAVLTFIWLLAFDVPFALVLSVLVAVLDLIPLVGSTLAGVIIAVVALTVSLPVSLATVGFFIVLRLVEDYLLAPKIMGRTVQVPAVVTVVAVLLGGALLGIIGALLAIPVAAAVLLLIEEILFPRLDRITDESGDGATTST
ncbi:putative PurR-regulated permease PerM [Nocardia tenerifensis]|uniref:Putative PurR-regulated permease PerM n=1 Tax=Nocardia tenerifensis TaxID=228006 RepID=A0A318KFM1_9NOCA|nr:AI-2E family transporter [Nocardia tenerifensis]PXX71023.1 putative PurR-regulated permease PerM [Nocardia tenerifensis]